MERFGILFTNFGYQFTDFRNLRLILDTFWTFLKGFCLILGMYYKCNVTTTKTFTTTTTKTISATKTTTRSTTITTVAPRSVYQHFIDHN